jgi:hypothetical protein
MRCNPSARWGPGTTKEKQVDTEGSKELKTRMEQMIKEREKQNNMWVQVSEKTEIKSETNFSSGMTTTNSSSSSSR